ncbi:MAG: hypothetical protein OZ921_08620 [Sorangiineae bacterium]|nr:hypothetical protein [Sorangiineae bacterium]
MAPSVVVSEAGRGRALQPYEAGPTETTVIVRDKRRRRELIGAARAPAGKKPVGWGKVAAWAVAGAAAFGLGGLITALRQPAPSPVATQTEARAPTPAPALAPTPSPEQTAAPADSSSTPPPDPTAMGLEQLQVEPERPRPASRPATAPARAAKPKSTAGPQAGAIPEGI